MKQIKLKYGREEKQIQVHEKNYLGLIQRSGMRKSKSEQEIIQGAMENPIGSGRLRSIVKPGETVCIVISDITRAWQKTGVYLPYIVDELNQAGIEDRDITFLCATGSHRGQTREEHEILLGEQLAPRFTVIDHNCRDKDSLVSIGTTSYGTPVIINRIALESDHIVLTGAVVFHDLAGWGGGKKSILPGIAAYESIMANHRLSLNPNLGDGTNFHVRCGNVSNNPVHLDMLEAAELVQPDFLFNVIMDEKGNIGSAVAGHYIKAHEAAQQIVDQSDSVCLSEKGGIVIASAGGYPKDIDLYQSSKALINAKEAVKKGGVIVLLAECREGFGGSEVQQMLEDFSDNPSREKELREAFSVAKYTGYMIAEIAECFRVILVSSIDPKQVENANLRVTLDVNEAIRLAIQEAGEEAKIYIMPFGASTLPRMTCN